MTAHYHRTAYCNTPDNKEDIYYEPAGKLIQKPKVKNKDNDCSSYEKCVSWWRKIK